MTDTEIVEWLCWNGHKVGIKPEWTWTRIPNGPYQPDAPTKSYTDIRELVRNKITEDTCNPPSNH